jgi:hypothetical protein
MSISKRTVLAVAAIAGIAATGGSAFTGSNDVADSVAGYGTSAVSGATVTSVVHTLSADGTAITSTKLTFDESQEGRTVKAGFDTGSLQTCTVDGGGLTATCDYTTEYTTEGASSFNVAVS